MKGQKVFGKMAFDCTCCGETFVFNKSRDVSHKLFVLQVLSVVLNTDLGISVEDLVKALKTK